MSNEYGCYEYGGYTRGCNQAFAISKSILNVYFKVFWRNESNHYDIYEPNLHN